MTHLSNPICHSPALDNVSKAKEFVKIHIIIALNLRKRKIETSKYNNSMFREAELFKT
jgi:hypothetical protein